MQINQVKFAKVVEAAKARTNDKRWIAAIEKAAEQLRTNRCITELADGLLITSDSGKTYHSNGTCQCKAHEFGQPCWHRAAARLVERYNELDAAVQAASAPTPGLWDRMRAFISRNIGWTV